MAGALTALKVRSLKEPGRYGDGAGLFLVVGPTGSRKWVLRIQKDGRRRDIGLGGGSVSLAEAREAADKARRQIRQGLDPVVERKKAAAGTPTFAEAARACHAEHKPGWKNAKHAAQWLTTLETYAFPDLGAKPVDKVDGPAVRDVLSPIWLTIPETARRVRQRITVVLDYAHARGWRPDEAPLRSVRKGLPRQPRTVDRHLPAMPWQEVPAFLQALEANSKLTEPARLLLRFLVLTAVRSGEARGTRWSEIDVAAGLWSIPAARMKAKRPHVVPLSAEALAVLERAKALRTTTDPEALVFPGERKGRPLSDMTLTMALRRMGLEVVPHGFRSSFRDWAGEATSFPREVAELALAHVVGGKVERSYARSDLLEKRRKLMAAWGAFCRAGRRGR